jgi:hypothetical protein
MQVTVGSEWPTSGGGRRSYALALDREDLADFMGEETVSAMTRKEVLTHLNKRAEVLVLAYVAKEGGCSQEFAANRIHEILGASNGNQ